MYDTNLAQQMAAFCELTYQQYQNGLPPTNNGDVPMPAGFTQIASFTAPEIALSSTNLAAYKNVHWKSLTTSQDLLPMAAGLQDVYFGFAATSASYNVIAIRGTRSIFEWVIDSDVPQVPVPLVWYHNGGFEVAKVHMGFLIEYSFLAEQIFTACQQFNNALPCLVTGHSLGAALATLAAPSIQLLTSNNNVQMYNFASPRVGNPAFVGAYSALIPESYRVVNLSDLVPMLPPTDVIWDYEHVPTEWSFLNQTGNVTGNHALIGADNYIAAVTQNIPTDAPRTYPVSGL